MIRTGQGGQFRRQSAGVAFVSGIAKYYAHHFAKRAPVERLRIPARSAPYSNA